MSEFERVAYSDGGTALTGLLARPAGTARAAVLVFPTIMNPTPAVADKARALAGAGYLALIADYYGEAPEDFVHARALAASVRPDPVAWRSRLRAARKALACLRAMDYRSQPSVSVWVAKLHLSWREMAHRWSTPLASTVF